MLRLDRRSLMLASAGAAITASARIAAAQSNTAVQPATPAPTSASIEANTTNPSDLNLPEPNARKGAEFEHGGARIFYQTMGQGAPMLLVHGYPLSGALFGRVAGTLSQNHQLVLPDLRGYGKSHAPGITDSVEPYADDMLALMEKLGLRKAIIGGMSMGGPVVLAMYKKAPERFDGLVLIDTDYRKASPAEAGEWRGVAEMIEAGKEMDVTQMLLPQMLTGQTRANDIAQVDYLKAIIKPASKDALVSGARALAGREDATELLGKINVPTLVVVGQDDALYGVEVAKMMQGKIKGAQLHVVPNAAHAAIFEKPDDAGQAIASWAQGVGGGAK